MASTSFSIPVTLPLPSPRSQLPPPSPKTLKTKQDQNLSLLQLCLHLKEGTQIHALLLKSSLSSDPYFAGRLVEFYALTANHLPSAHQILHSLHSPPLFIYNTLMRANLNNQFPLKSIHLFNQLLSNSLEPDRFSLTFALKASSMLPPSSSNVVGKQLHSLVIKLGLQSNPHIRSKLINCYAVCGRNVDARKVFDTSPDLDVVAWNSMLHLRG